MLYALLIVTLAPFVLVALLRPALLGYEQPARYWYCVPLTVIAAVADLITCRTWWVMLAGWPTRGEWFVSQTLERLCVAPGPNLALFREIGRAVNRKSPSGRHIRILSGP